MIPQRTNLPKFAGVALLAALFSPEPARADDSGGPFADVPITLTSRHPAYDWRDTLEKKLGFSAMFMNCWGGRRALTRYEFAVATQRLHAQLLRPHASASPRLRRTLTNRASLLEAASLIERLTGEFERELQLLGYGEPAAETMRQLRALRERPSEAMRRLRAVFDERETEHR